MAGEYARMDTLLDQVELAALRAAKPGQVPGTRACRAARNRRSMPTMSRSTTRRLGGD
jgi:hypothetical protein